MLRLRRQQALALAAVLLIAAVLACGPSGGGTAPSVVITSPASGTTVQVGVEVPIVSTAAADNGVARVELSVNGQLVRTDTPPSGNPPTFAVSQPWTPMVAGDVTVSVVAYDTEGAASQPAVITLHVGAGGAAGGPTPTPAPDVSGPGGCTLNASFVADVTIPDNTVMAPGTAFTKIWRVRNSGTCDWGAGFTLVFASGEQMGGPSSVAVPATASGSTADVAVNLVAPNTPGTYRGTWRLKSDTGQVFGSSVYVQIVIPSPITPTSAPTVGPTAPAAAGPTNLQCQIQADGKAHCTWTDAVGEAGYRYEFSFAAGTVGATESHPLSADTSSWTSSALACDGDGSFTIIALAGDGSEIGRQTATFETPACAGPTTVDLQASGDSFWWPQNMICMAGMCPDWGHGSALELKNGSSGGGGLSVFYPGLVAVRFDLGGIPAGATIDEATLYLRLTSAEGASSANLRVARADSPWSEDDHSVKPGCESSGAVTRAVGIGSGWYDWNVTDLVQYQLANPTTNYGFCVTGGTVDDVRVFASREASASSRPYLRVTYRP